MSRRWLVVALVAAAGAGACSRGEHTPAHSVPATAAIQLLPVDSDFVLSLDMSQLQRSPVFKKLLAPQMKEARTARLAKFLDRCGIDPLPLIQRVSIGVTGTGGRTLGGTAVFHGPSEATLKACWTSPETGTQSVDNDVSLVVDEDGYHVGSTAVNDTTTVFVIGKDVTAADVRATVSGASALGTSPGFVDMFRSIRKSDTGWFFINGHVSLVADALDGVKPRAVFGSISITDRIRVEARLRLDSAAQATKVLEQVRARLIPIAILVDNLDVTRDGEDIRMIAQLSEHNLADLLKRFPRLGN